MNPAPRPGQTIVHRILDHVQALKSREIKVRLCWIPGHKGNIGNQLADQLAKQAVSANENHNFRHPVSTYKGATCAKIAEEWRSEWVKSGTGKHLKRIDDALPVGLPASLTTILTNIHCTHLASSSEKICAQPWVLNSYFCCQPLNRQEVWSGPSTFLTRASGRPPSRSGKAASIDI